MRGRNSVPLQKFFGKTFAGLQPGGCLGWTKNAQPRLLKYIDNAESKRILGSDHGETDFVFLGETNQIIEVGRLDGDIDAVLPRSGVSRSAIYLFGAPRLCEFPNQSMFAAATSQDQDSHICERQG